MKTTLLLLQIVVGSAILARAQNQPADPAVTTPAEPSKSESKEWVLGPISLASTNKAILDEILARPPARLRQGTNQGNIAKFTARVLANNHYSRQPMDDSVASKFLDRYLETLDNQHLHFLQSDLDEFAKYRTSLDELTAGRGDVRPAHEVFNRFLQRLEQRVAYVRHLLQNELFEFNGEDRYNLNRREAPRPQDLDAAHALWRQHLRYEVLQEKLNKEKPSEISNKITRRYARLLRTFKDLDSDDIFEIYLSALTRVYDPHSDYLGKAGLDSFNIGMKLSLFGIGAQLTTEDGYCKIVSLVPGGPAKTSNKLKVNDRIIAVAQGTNDSVDVVDMKLSKVVDMIRGAKGTEVRLTIIPADAPDPSLRKTVALVRDEIKLEDQEAKAKVIDFPAEDGKVHRLGVIDLPSFYADFEASNRRGENRGKSTTVDVARLLRKLKQEKVEGIILDLRHNGGGSLDEAINLTGLFIKEGPVVQVKDPNDKVMVDEDEDPTVLYTGPLVVLTSRFSASASEILAGALQDYGRALIVGDASTHGKGTVQSLIQLDPYIAPNSGALKITIRKFYRASGSSTQVKGVVPDIVLPSVNNHADVGEGALENPLPWDTVRSARFEPLNRIQPILPNLLARSSKRIESDPDFAYVNEDIQQLKKALADRTVSLNEQQRLKEKQEALARNKARQADLKSRPPSLETVYELSLKQALVEGLPDPVSKTNEVAAATAPQSIQADDDDGEEKSETGDEVRVPMPDAAMKEAKRILIDLIAAWSGEPSIAGALIN